MSKFVRSLFVVFVLLAVLASVAVAGDLMETDVIVVGGGAAGLSAAVEAAQAGVSVILFEKYPFLGGSTMVSGGGMSGAGNQFQIEAGIVDDSPEIHFADLLREGAYRNNLLLAKVFTENAGAAIDWLAELGCEFSFAPGFPEHSIQRFVRSYPYPGTGIAIIQALENAAREAGADIQLYSTVTELVTNTAGEVIGVQGVRGDGSTFTALGQKVILATGGYVGSEDLLWEFAPDIMAMDPAVAGDTRLVGDGFIMGQKVGASLENMQYIKLYPTGSQLVDGSDVFVRYYVATAVGGILVNREGERFVDELGSSFVQIYDALVQQTDARMFVIFDDAMAEEAAEAATPLVLGWDNERVRADYEEQTLVKRRDSISELADAMGIDGSQLAAASADVLGDGPYYGVEIGPNMMFTLGGIRINDKAEVLDVNGQIIPGLFAAGEVAGAGHGNNYMSGNYISYAVVFGRIAGQTAAADIQ